MAAGQGWFLQEAELLQPGGKQNTNQQAHTAISKLVHSKGTNYRADLGATSTLGHINIQMILEKLYKIVKSKQEWTRVHHDGRHLELQKDSL